MSAKVFSLAGKRVWVAGHSGLVGSALLRRLAREPIGELIAASSSSLDLHGPLGRIQVEPELASRGVV